jgi:hypothetical protein
MNPYPIHPEHNIINVPVSKDVIKESIKEWKKEYDGSCVVILDKCIMIAVWATTLVMVFVTNSRLDKIIDNMPSSNSTLPR